MRRDRRALETLLKASKHVNMMSMMSERCGTTWHHYRTWYCSRMFELTHAKAPQISILANLQCHCHQSMVRQWTYKKTILTIDRVTEVWKWIKMDWILPLWLNASSRARALTLVLIGSTLQKSIVSHLWKRPFTKRKLSKTCRQMQIRMIDRL